MPEERRLVSVLFADVVGSTAFGADNDPEMVRSVMARYFERMKEVAETHGGTVEKFIGDAVMVVFGVPRLHDDDAERAVRAALAMREEVVALDRELEVDLAVRIGVNTGHAVAATTAEQQFLVTGDAVNVAARLQQGAEIGEVVVGPLTEQMTRAAIEYAAHAPVAAKGKTEPLTAFLAVRASTTLPEQARGLPSMRAQLVGRQRELRLLIDAFGRVKDEGRAHVFTIVGPAGVGKSRLVGEALARLSTMGGARVLRGRCLPYGAGITYWPLIEILRADTGISAGDDRAGARAKLESRVRALFPEAEARGAAARLAVLLGLDDASAALAEVPPDAVARELAWAARRHLEGIAREPTIVAIDDLQWAEQPVVDLIDGMSDAWDVPLLLLCVARPQLLEARPTWGAASGNTTRITLSPLTRDETATLIGRLLDIDDLPEELRARIVDRSGGNPLFCEEFIRMLIDEGRIERVGDRWRAGGGVADVRVPESIEALIAARLDGLAAPEKRALQVASVIGERFATDQVLRLDDDPSLGPALLGLRRKDLVVRDPAAATSDDLRFKHLLIREVAYASLPKAARAALHERFGDLLQREIGDRRDEFAEILGHHAERAFTFSAELRLGREIVRARARRALGHALALAERGRQRGDAALLLTYARIARAAGEALAGDLAADEEVRVALAVANAFVTAGSYADALATYRRAAERAAAAGEQRLSAEAHLGTARALIWMGPKAEEFVAELDAAGRAFAAASDDRGVLESDLLRLEVHWARGTYAAMVEEGSVLLERARALGDAAGELRIAARLYMATFQLGRRDLADQIEATAARITSELGARLPAWIALARCQRLRIDGDAAEAERCWREKAAEYRSTGEAQQVLGSLRNLAELLIFAGRHEEAAALVEEALERSIRMGEGWSRAELTASKALVHLGRGELAEAGRVAESAREAVHAGDAFARIWTDLAAALVGVAQGRPQEAAVLVEGALAALRRTDFGSSVVDLLVMYAERLNEQGLPGADQAIAEGERIVQRTGLRGDVRQRLDALRSKSPAR